MAICERGNREYEGDMKVKTRENIMTRKHRIVISTCVDVSVWTIHS